jgi:hypothetical protein
MVAPNCNSSTQEAEQEKNHEFQVSLNYRVAGQYVRPCPKKKKKR